MAIRGLSCSTFSVAVGCHSSVGEVAFHITDYLIIRLTVLSFNTMEMYPSRPPSPSPLSVTVDPCRAALIISFHMDGNTMVLMERWISAESDIPSWKSRLMGGTWLLIWPQLKQTCIFQTSTKWEFGVVDLTMTQPWSQRMRPTVAFPAPPNSHNLRSHGSFSQTASANLIQRISTVSPSRKHNFSLLPKPIK